MLIVRGGLTGVEPTAEIAVDFPTKKVRLVHRGSRLLEFIGESAINKALNWLTSNKVEVILGSGGETTVADCHFLCNCTPFGSAWLKETILKDNGCGRVMVDPSLRINGRNNIFAIGDITDVSNLNRNFRKHDRSVVISKGDATLVPGVLPDIILYREFRFSVL
ncbi:putative inositol oxygenase 2-like [Capsicum annuum]|nr:putative inositol oxygenase 2-like [Capsicum annuum]